MLAGRFKELGRSAEFRCPQLPASPRQAIQMVSAMVEQVPPAQLTLIGSSLGGYYATWLAEQIGCRAVLLNPAINPARDLEHHVGVTTAFHSDEPFEFKRKYIGELTEMAIQRITQPERYFLIAATGDEVLDWREMTAHFAGARQHVIQGSDHGLSDFENYMDEVLAFCGIETGRSD